MLEKLIKEKISKNKNNKKIKIDLKALSEIKNKNNFKIFEQNKIIVDDITKIELNLAKSFLDFLKNELNHKIHKNDENEYINKDRKKINDFQLYLKDKFIKCLSIDESLNILFPFNLEYDFIGEGDYKILLEKQDEFKKDVDKFGNTYKNFFSIKIPQIDFELDFKEKINEIIMRYVNQFEKEVLYKLNEIFDLLLEEKIKYANKNKIIEKISSFIKSFITICLKELNKNNSHSKNQKQLIYYLKIKSNIIQKIICFFETCKKKVINALKEKDKNLKIIMETINTNLTNLKKDLVKNKESKNENEFQIYLKWIENESYSYDLSLYKLKMYYKTYIKKTLNLEMSYTYDSQFCFWAIKNVFTNYLE